ncbi:MAG: arsenate reductase [Polaromonas sp.]|uniref:arsenate reductase n=1 Tax=Polaromonas sp. TaxID=1869339 RepID=UPI00272FF074|nr:arsenate reductase [Polaromonas sp.]MDP1742779.1 arsenate reductase [Polaromonas sp.]MDP1955528.1 arsenate reductase [Polaromonas sp.]MDP3356346.1 arsenate reductase [Polaromonas sp.]MDP3753366.1 arsenate reductase [Polaromonas sp.]
MIIVYGISNCDSVKKARAWLAERGLACEFHDFKKLGVPTDRLAAWEHAVGWEKLLNRQGTTWRKLDAAAQAGIKDAASAMALMQAQPSIIKRPVVEWGPKGSATTVGFDPASWAARLS